MATFSHVIHDTGTIYGAGASESAAWADFAAQMQRAGIDTATLEDVECSPGVSAALENGGPLAWTYSPARVTLRGEV